MNGISKLADSFDGMPCLVLSKDTPFKLAKLLAQNKTSAPAKAGQKAPNDIYIRAGPTPFSPGPVIGELGALGIKSGVENGKIAIKVDKLLVKSGAVINEQQASILGRLGITPMEIGISLAIAYENGDFYSREVLAVDASQYLGRLQAASREALALTVELGLIMPENINFLLQKATAQAKKLETLKDANQLNTGIQEG
jgi:large subunit ribosomal protein L10